MRIPFRFGFICFFSALFLSGCPNVREESQLALSRCDGTASPFASGGGSSSDPYLICSASQLQNVASYLTSSFKLGKNISLQGVSFSPIGANDTTGFSGTFDGAGYTISNWTYSNTSDPYAIGFVRKLATGGVIQNLTLSTVVLNGNDVVAGFAGFSQGTLSSVTLRNALLNSKSTVAGIVGEATGSASVISSKVELSALTSSANGDRMNAKTGSGKMNAVAGVAGVWLSSGSITKSTVSSTNLTFDISSLFHELLFTFSGGVVGYLETGAAVSESTYSGTVTGYFDVGGIAGFAAGSVSDSSVNGTVSGNTRVGGVAGLCTGSVTRSSAVGIVLGDDINQGIGGGAFAGSVGGVIGVLSGSLSESFFSGTVDADKRVGGLVGLASGATINDCYAQGTVAGEIDPVAGAFGALDAGSTTRVYVYMTSINGGATATSREFEGPGSTAINGTHITNSYYFDNAIVANGSLGSGFSSLSLFQDISNFTGFVASGNWASPTAYAGRSVLSPVLAWECGKSGITCAP